MSEAKLDQIVKGAPPPHVSSDQLAAAALSSPPDASSPSSPSDQQNSHVLDAKRPYSSSSAAAANPSDPLSQLPSSPPQIYLNLLILEASLRSQYLALRARRRLHIFSLTLLGLWTLYFGYVLFLRPREDGKGVGGSPYWLFDMGARISFMGGVLTFILIYATGTWDRGVKWPRRWLSVTNRGLRTMNLKVIVLRGPWWKQLASYFAFLFPYSSLSRAQGSSFHYVELPEKRAVASSSTAKYAYRDGYHTRNMRLEDLEPGGDHVKLLLLPKPFSPKFRDDWEKYRAEYWHEENMRRAELRRVVDRRLRDSASQRAGWFRWTGWRGWRAEQKNEAELAKAFNAAAHHSRHPSGVRPARRRGSVAHPTKDAHSRSSSRSSSIASDFDDGRGLAERRGTRKSRISHTRPGGSGRMQLSMPDGATSVSKRASIISTADSIQGDSALADE